MDVHRPSASTLGALGALLATLAIASLARSRPPAAPPPIDVESVPTGPLDLNAATAEDLERLPRIGPALASRIVAYRAAHGAFRSVEELDEVPGVGPSTLARLHDLVTVSSPTGNPAPLLDADRSR